MQMLPITQFSKKLYSTLQYSVLICLLGYLFIGLFPPVAEAEGTSLKIQPSVLQIRATTPADIHAPFTLTNEGFEAVKLQILLKRFRNAGDETGRIVYSNQTDFLKNDADTFLNAVKIVDGDFVVQELTLGPKQQKKLDLRINLPQEAKSQDHYFSIIFLSSPNVSDELAEESEKNNSLSMIQAGVSLPVLVSVNQKKEPVGVLDEFSGPLLLQSGPVPFTVKVENTGEHFIEARGAIFIKNMFGQTVGKVELPKTNILSGSTRGLTFNTLKKEVFTSRDSKSEVVWSETFLLGLYTATIHLAISPDESLYTQTIYFFAFPAVGFVFLIVGLAVGFFVLRRIKKRLSQ